VRWDATGLWVMLAIGSALGVVVAARVKFRAPDRMPRRFRDAPVAFLGACVDAVLTGIGVGIAAVFVIMVLAGVLFALGL